MCIYLCIVVIYVYLKLGQIVSFLIACCQFVIFEERNPNATKKEHEVLWHFVLIDGWYKNGLINKYLLFNKPKT